jgi:hypothetical protein
MKYTSKVEWTRLAGAIVYNEAPVKASRLVRCPKPIRRLIASHLLFVASVVKYFMLARSHTAPDTARWGVQEHRRVKDPVIADARLKHPQTPSWYTCRAYRARCSFS